MNYEAEMMTPTTSMNIQLIWRLDTGKHHRMYPACSLFYLLEPCGFQTHSGVAGGHCDWERVRVGAHRGSGRSVHTQTRGFVEHTAAPSCLQPGCVSTDRQ